MQNKLPFGMTEDQLKETSCFLLELEALYHEIKQNELLTDYIQNQLFYLTEEINFTNVRMLKTALQSVWFHNKSKFYKPDRYFNPTNSNTDFCEDSLKRCIQLAA